MGSKIFRILQCSSEAGSSLFIMKQPCLVLFLKVDSACGDQEILIWTMSRTILGSLWGSPVSFFLTITLRTVLVVYGNSLLMICRNPRILYSKSVRRKIHLTQICKTTNLVSHEGISFFAYFKSSMAAAQTEFWHNWSTSPGGAQAGDILSLASKQLLARQISKK